MPKANIHPAWFPNAPVFCEGKCILKLGSTKTRISVDTWSEKNAFYKAFFKNEEQETGTVSRKEIFEEKFGQISLEDLFPS